MKTYNEFKKFTESRPKMRMMSWAPKDHWQYWFYTFMIKLGICKKYWFTKRCNFIHKPFIDSFTNIKPYSEINTPNFSEEKYFWEIITK